MCKHIIYHYLNHNSIKHPEWFEHLIYVGEHEKNLKAATQTTWMTLEITAPEN